MKSLFGRVWQSVFGGAPAKPEPARVAQAERRRDPAVTTADSAQQGADKTAALMAVGARRPLISGAGDVVGFEFRVGDAVLQRLKRRTDQQGHAAYLAAMLASARLVAQTGRVGFARVSADWLQYAAGQEAGPGTWIGLELPSGGNLETTQVQAIAQAVSRLRAAGAKVGWPVTSELGLAPDFMLLRQGSDPMAALLEAAKVWPAAVRALPTLATDIANVDDLEAALRGGISHVCGALAASPAAAGAQEIAPVRPEVRRVGQLLKQLVSDTDTSRIVGEIKGDVALSYGLLRRVNSASFAQWNANADIDKAVAMFGRNELYRWLSVLLIQFAGSRKVSSALHEIALWRSRLLELLATGNNEPAPGQLFTLGLSSMLGQILKISAADVVSTLNLPAPARQALLEQAGPWHIYLQMALHLEAQDIEATETLARQFGGLQRVMEMSDAAWAWAAEHSERKGAETATVAP